MLSINEAAKKITELIRSRTSSMQFTPAPVVLSPERVLGELMLDKFALQLVNSSVMIYQNQDFEEEIIENILTSLALAGILGIDIEKHLNHILEIMESVSSEAS